MTIHRLFLCYSRKDEASRDRFLVHLDPFVRAGKLGVWYDKRIGAGDRWEDEIFHAIDQATAAVVLVSPDLLKSNFVMEKELPRLFRAKNERDLLLTSLFVRPSSFEISNITIQGREHGLADLQGLNDPQEPLAPGSEGDRMLKTAVDQLYRALEERPVADPRDRPRQEIHIRLERRNGKIIRRSGPPPYFESHISQGNYPEQRLKALERSDERQGRLLFEILLGNEQEQLKALSTALGRALHSPDRYAFRVRILCDDDTLRQLPWSLCRTASGALVEQGWTFELTASSTPPLLCHLPSPCRALFVAAEIDGLPELHAARHQRAFESLLMRAWGTPLKGTLLTRVSDRRALREALEHEPRLLYIYAHGRVVAKGSELLLGDGPGCETLPLTELAEWLERHPPQLVVLNTPEAMDPLPASRRIAACLQLRGLDDLWKTRQYAIEWWQAILQLDHDPARAFSSLPDAARNRALLTTSYGPWEHEHQDFTPKVDRARAHLDRSDQRRIVREAVEKLVRGPRRRLTCLVAYGAEGNLVQHFAVQLAATLKIQAHHLARLVPHRLGLPDKRSNLGRHQIRDAFREDMRLQPPDGLEDAFGHAARGPNAKPVHFFDWGTYPSPRHGPKLKLTDLETWIDFCREELTGACPDSARGLAYISLVTDEQNHAKLARWLAAKVGRDDTPRFSLVPIPALGTVGPKDLLHFLMDEHNSSCPEDLHHSLAPRIVAKTGGSFEATVELLEEAEKGHRWFELDEELPPVDIKTETAEDFEL